MKKKLKAKSKTLKHKIKSKTKKSADRSPLYEAFVRALAPRPPLSIDEWADQYRVLPEISAHEAGLWRTERFPFLRRIMQLLSPSDPCQQIVVMKGAQLGFTECAINYMFYTIDYSPAPMLYVQKTLVDMDVFVKQRFEPSLDEMPDLAARVGTQTRGRKTGDTAKVKVFPGGMIRFGGANSAASLRSMPIERLILDEEDSYDQDIQDEGSPSELAIRRTANFPRRKIYRLSTPTMKETSVIEPLFEGGTKERYYVPCPDCGHMDYIRWDRIKWENDDPKTACLLCTKCGVLIEERHKTKMLMHGEWRPENPEAPYPSFHISSLYSPYGFYRWSEAVSLYLRAIRTHDNALLKTFVNTVLGETWSESGRIIKANILMERKEQYPAEVPDGPVILTGAADVQKDRIEAEIVGWGPGMESWGIEYAVFRGDTERPEVWIQLDQFFNRGWKTRMGAVIPVSIAVVDSGFLTKTVYEFCRLRSHRNIFPVKGDEGWGHGYIDRPLRMNKFGVYPFRAFVDEIKNKLYSYFTIKEPGPGYCHWPKKDCYDKAYFGQLTSEYLDKKWVNGRYRLKWILPQGRRNEALDVRCLNVAALNILNPQFDTLQMPEQQVVIQRSGARRRRRVLSRGII